MQTFVGKMQLCVTIKTLHLNLVIFAPTAKFYARENKVSITKCAYPTSAAVPSLAFAFQEKEKF